MGSTRFGSQDPEYNTQAEYYKSLRGQYDDSLNKYTGNAGYQNSLEQGKIGAQTASVGAEQAAARTARTGGMSAASSSAMGSAQGAKGYYDAFNQQQNAAYQSGLSNVQGYNQAMSNQLGLMETQQKEKDAEYNRAWGNVGNTLGIVGSFISAASDANLKNYYKISEKYKRKD